MKKNLNKLRSDIDKIDRDILVLLSKRAAIAKDIGTLKNDGVIYKPEREASLIAKLRKLNQGPLSQASVINIFKSIISNCRALEKKIKRFFFRPARNF